MERQNIMDNQDNITTDSSNGQNGWDQLSLVLAVLTQVVVIGLAALAIVSDIFWPNVIYPHPNQPIHGLPAKIILPFLPFVAMPLILPSLSLQWMRGEWHKWWNFAYGCELLIVIFPFALSGILIILYGILMFVCYIVFIIGICFVPIQ